MTYNSNTYTWRSSSCSARHLPMGSSSGLGSSWLATAGERERYVCIINQYTTTTTTNNKKKKKKKKNINKHSNDNNNNNSHIYIYICIYVYIVGDGRLGVGGGAADALRHAREHRLLLRLTGEAPKYFIYIYIYTHTYTYTHAYAYIYIYTYTNIGSLHYDMFIYDII